MEVIEKGPGIEIRCSGNGNGGGGCGALLSFTREDVYAYAGVPGESWGSRDPAQCIKCPVCYTITDLPSNKQVGNPAHRWTHEWYRNLPARDTER